MSKVQDDEVGDGTTSVTVLAAELLREAEKLIAQKIHPQTIIAGWRKACDAARDALLKSTHDNADNEEAFRQDLINIARTTLSSKLLTHFKDYFAKLAVDAVLRLKKHHSDLESIQIIKKLGGRLEESFLDEGSWRSYCEALDFDTPTCNFSMKRFEFSIFLKPCIF